MRPLGKINCASRSGRDILDQSSTMPSGASALRGWFKRLALELVFPSLVDGELTELKEIRYIRGIVLPAGTNDLVLLPEGARGWDHQILWTDEDLKVELNTIVLYNGVRHRIMKAPISAEFGVSKYLFINGYSQ